MKMPRLTLVALLATTPLSAAVIDTTWIGPGSGSWNTASNWSNGVPNNTASDVYNVTITNSSLGLGPSLSSSVVVENMSLANSGVSTKGYDLTINGDLSNTGSLGASSGGTVHIGGTVAQQVGGTLTGGLWSVYEFPSSKSTSTIEWAGADIHTISAKASVYLSGTNTSLKDTTSGLSALRNLSQIDGDLDLDNHSLSVSGDFSNTGHLSASNGSTLTVSGGLSDTGSLYVGSGSTVHIDGAVAQQVAGTLTEGSWRVSASSSSPATVEWAGADIHTIGANASVVLGYLGSLKDTTTGLSALRNLSQIDGSLDLSAQSLTVSGSLSNTGSLSGDGSTIAVSGDFSNTGSLSAENGCTLSVSGDFSNKGVLSAGYGSRIHIGGAVAQQVGGTLTNGSWIVNENAPFSSTPATIEWAGADIHTIGAKASVSLGRGASLKDTTTGLSALRNLSQIDGSLTLSASFTISGDLSNTGVLSTSNGSTLTVSGGLSNTGTLSAGYGGSIHIGGAVAQQVNGTLTDGSWIVNRYAISSITPATIEWAGADIHTIGANASVSLSGTNTSLKDTTSGLSALRNLSQIDGSLTLSNGETIAVSGGFSNTGILSASNGSSIHIGGAVAQQVNGTLTAGSWSVSGSSSSPVIIEWAGADIHTIGAKASVSLNGTSAALKDTISGLSALRNLSQIDGSLDLTGQSLTVSGNLSNTGHLSASSGSTVHIGGGVAQQVNGTLTDGHWSVSGSSSSPATIEWAGANIYTIGAKASVSLGGTGILKDTISGRDALRYLSRINGSLSLDGVALPASIRNITVNGSLSLSGKTPSTFGGSLYFASTGLFTVGFVHDSIWGETTGGITLAGNTLLNGTLAIDFDYFDLDYPAADKEFIILSALSLTGEFTNVAEGGRIAVTTHDDALDIEKTIGSFEVSYAGNKVTLSDFQAVPEPATWALLLAGGFCLVLRKRRQA
jgi:hypothetical protein